INKGYLRGAWKSNEIKGLVFVNLSSLMIKDLTFLKRAWDDNFSPSSFKGIENPYQYLINAGFKVAESSMYNKNVIDERKIPYLVDEIIKSLGGDPTKVSDSLNISKADATGSVDLVLRSQFASENGDLGNVSGGPSSLGMIMEFYGLKKSTPELAKLCGTRSGAGTGFNEMVTAAKKLGFDDSRIKTGCDIDWLKSMTDAKKPVMVHVNTAGFWPQGHYMVATGVKDGKVIVADPWTGRTNSYSIAQFKAMWATRQNRAIIIEKSGANASVAKASSATTKTTASAASTGNFPSPGAEYLKASSKAPSTNAKIVAIAKSVR
ncbi:MAG TPA: cysteine peptidase family C39 domain-containing protein, partial [Candidatus Wallbacteria bacterium]|nr:cysteine peptidase family C39 domain-containing protein [Candidatus Wallbacteria bacterium]